MYMLAGNFIYMYIYGGRGKRRKGEHIIQIIMSMTRENVNT